MMTVTNLSQGILLTELLDGLVGAGDCAWNDVTVLGLTLDSRAVKSGDVFVACVGANQDGRDFIPQAIQQGAVAVMVDQLCEGDHGVDVIVVPHLMAKLSLIAGRLFNEPSKAYPLLAVTGTNGKTSCTQIMAQLLKGLNKRCAVIGTLGVGVDGDLQAGLNTTPDAISIQRYLSDWREQSIDCVAMEVSSHGLEQGRVEALQFDVALFTNLTRDHLDYHGDMQNYGAAKARLFTWPSLKTAVLNSDDAYSAEIKKELSKAVTLISYSIRDQSAEVYASDVHYSSSGVVALLHSPWGQARLNCCLLGGFNLSNVLAAISCLASLGYSFKELVAAAVDIKPVAGRMELIASGDVSVVVDYSHTPDALEQALAALRLHTDKRLHCVFGCGGDRDQGKRPLMGEVASRLADEVWLTSDNPRHENADEILKQVLSGVNADDKTLHVDVDRARAIESAIVSASAGDVILLAGKGHEDYQQFGDDRLPFNDAVQARLALAKRAAL